MTYITPTGRRFTLAYHTLDEWADRIHTALISLGCTDEYATRAADEYRNARRPS